ncbi:MAG: hypothetical protein NY202_03850 [Mollicutes bacterium UO1]
MKKTIELLRGNRNSLKSELGEEQKLFEQKSTELQKKERQENLEQNNVSRESSIP